MGGGLATDGVWKLNNTMVDGNTAYASGRIATARGGGIFDAAVPDNVQGGPLTLVNSSVQRNTLSGSGGASRYGGGVVAG